MPKRKREKEFHVPSYYQSLKPSIKMVVTEVTCHWSDKILGSLKKVDNDGIYWLIA